MGGFKPIVHPVVFGDENIVVNGMNNFGEIGPDGVYLLSLAYLSKILKRNERKQMGRRFTAREGSLL